MTLLRRAIPSNASPPGRPPGRRSHRRRALVLGFSSVLLMVGLLPTLQAAPSAETIWPSTARPLTLASTDRTAVELGVKFKASVSGTVSALRFYKGAGNSGTHYGNLWTASGGLLATVTFKNETASGWQQATLSTPVAIAAGKTYVASYYAPFGRYSQNLDYFKGKAFARGSLTAPADTLADPNGVYRTGRGFPNKTYRSSNYWVDVLFTPSSSVTPAAALAIDPSSPPPVAGPGTRTTASFTPPAGSLLVAMVAYDTGWAGEGVPTGPNNQSLSSTPALTWTLAGRKSPDPASTGGKGTDGGAEIWTARVGASTAHQVTASAPNDLIGSLNVTVLTGAEATPGGAVAAAAGDGTAQVSLTTTRANSMVFSVASDWFQTGPRAVGAGQTLMSVFDHPGIVTTHVWRPTLPVPAAGTPVLSNLAAPAGQRYNVLAVEVRASTDGDSTTTGTTTTTMAPPTSSTTAPPSPTTTVPPPTTTTTVPPTTTTTTAPPPPPPPPPGGGLSLPKVPWEGGPSYYSRFSQASATGWTSSSFFPIGVWFESVISQNDVNLDKGAGINSYFELTANSDLNLIRNNGQSAFPSDSLLGSPAKGNETVGWTLDDEADMNYGPSAEGYNHMQSQATKLGDGRMRYANYGKGVMMWQSDADAARYVNSYTTVVSNDIYWYTDPNICWEMNNFHGIPQSQCRRAANYGFTMDRMRYLDGLDNARQPVYAFVEVGHPFSEPDPVSPTIQADQIAGAVMNSLIHEARGIIYFNHNFGGSCISQHVLRDSCGAGVRPTVTEVNRRIKELAPVLNTQSYQHSFNAGLETMLKESNGSYYVFAMQKRDRTSGSYTFTLPAGMSGSSVQVLYENRTLPLSGGTFTDSFAAENSYHIYKIG